MNLPFLIGDGNFYDENSIKTHLENSSISPLTNKKIPHTSKGIILKTIQDEISAFVNALSVNNRLMNIKGDESVNIQEAIFKTAQEIGQQAEAIREQINFYIKQLRSSSKDVEMLADDMAKDPKLTVSSHVIAIAWTHIKALVGDNALTQAMPDSFLTLAPDVAMSKLLQFIKKIDASLDNFVISALREAMLEEQQVSKMYDSYQSVDPVQCVNSLWKKAPALVNESAKASQVVLPQTPFRLNER